MRQGDVAPTGSWIGNPQGGVTAPDPLILPDPARRFAATSARLQTLSDGHPMADWLRFMAGLAQAQHDAVARLAALPDPDAGMVGQAVEARMPPLAADKQLAGLDLCFGSGKHQLAVLSSRFSVLGSQKIRSFDSPGKRLAQNRR